MSRPSTQPLVIGDLASSVLSDEPSIGVTVVPAAVVLDGVNPAGVDLIVKASGPAALEDVAIAARPPPTAAWSMTTAVDRLEPGQVAVLSATFTGRVSGGGSTSIVISGTTVGRPVVATASISHGAPPALVSASFAGEDTVSNDRDMAVSLAVANQTDAEVGFAAEVLTSQLPKGVQVNTITCPAEPLGPRLTDFVTVILRGDALGTGDHVLRARVTAISGGATDMSTVSFPFSTQPISDGSLLSYLGLASLLIAPGTTAVLAYGWFRGRARQRRGVVGAATWLDLRSIPNAILVVAISSAAIAAHGALLRREALTVAFDLPSLVLVSILTAAAGWLAALVWSWVESRRFPVVDATSKPEAVLPSLAGWSGPERTVDGKKYLVLWEHDGLIALTPKFGIDRGDAARIVEEADVGHLKRAVKGGAATVVWVGTDGYGDSPRMLVASPSTAVVAAVVNAR